MNHAYATRDDVTSRAEELLSQIEIGHEFDWKTLFGQPDWTLITAEKRAQTVGDQLARYFSRDPDPVIEFVRVNRSPHFTVFRKIREVGRKGLIQ